MIDDATIQAFKDAWGAKRKEIGRGIAPAGTKTRAGLEAALPHIRAQIAAEIRAEMTLDISHIGMERAARIAKNGPTQ